MAVYSLIYKSPFVSICIIFVTLLNIDSVNNFLVLNITYTNQLLLLYFKVLIVEKLLKLMSIKVKKGDASLSRPSKRKANSDATNKHCGHLRTTFRRHQEDAPIPQKRPKKTTPFKVGFVETPLPLLPCTLLNNRMTFKNNRCTLLLCPSPSPLERRYFMDSPLV